MLGNISSHGIFSTTVKFFFYFLWAYNLVILCMPLVKHEFSHCFFMIFSEVKDAVVSLSAKKSISKVNFVIQNFDGFLLDYFIMSIIMLESTVTLFSISTSFWTKCDLFTDLYFFYCNLLSERLSHYSQQ